MQIVSAGYSAQPPRPSHDPVCPQALAATPWQTLWGSGFPWSVGQQVPPRPTWLHDRQAPLHATLQQTPSAQKPVAHSVSAVQIAPRGFLPQLPATHFCPLTQSLSTLQAAKHWLLVGSQLNGAQMVAAPGLQRPVPSHTSIPSTAAPLQVPARQTAPLGYLRQAPLPSHMPSRPPLETSDLAPWGAPRGGGPGRGTRAGP